MFNQSTFENHHSQSFPDESNMTLCFTPSSGKFKFTQSTFDNFADESNTGGYDIEFYPKLRQICFYPKLRQGRDEGGNGEEEEQGSTLG